MRLPKSSRQIEVLAGEDGRRLSVAATVVTENFAIHYRLNRRNAKRPDWAVTHLLTGRVIFYCQTKENARLAAHALEPLCDWQSAGPETFGTLPPATQEAIREIYMRFSLRRLVEVPRAR